MHAYKILIQTNAITYYNQERCYVIKDLTVRKIRPTPRAVHASHASEYQLETVVKLHATTSKVQKVIVRTPHEWFNLVLFMLFLLAKNVTKSTQFSFV